MGNILVDNNGNALLSNNKALEITSTIDSNIQAENIKKDITILGVTGTYEGSGGGGSNEITITWRYLSDINRYYFTKEDADKIKEIPSIIRCSESGNIDMYMLAYTSNGNTELCYYRVSNMSRALIYNLNNDTFVFLGSTYTYDSSTERYISEESDN